MTTTRTDRLLTLPVVALGLLAACTPRPAPTEPDTQPPSLTLQVGARSFSVDEGGAPDDACAKVRQFPANLSVSTGDGGGIARLTIRVFPGTISDASAAPDSAEVEVRDTSPGNLLVVTPRPPRGSVQPNLLVAFSVDRFSAVVVRSVDTSGNAAELYQVDVREFEDPVVCRDEPSS